MLQLKHPMASFATGLVQGLFRAGHLFLIALGFIALTQIVPTPQGTTRHIDAMGGSAESMVMPTGNDAADSPVRLWFTAVQVRIASVFPGLGIDTNSADAVTPVVDTTPHVVSPAILRLTAYLANRYHVSDQVVENLVVSAHDVGKELRIDPLLIVAVMAVESSFNPLSESKFGAQGLMQVIPKYHTDKLGSDAGELALFDPETNIRVGAMVLREYISRAGSVDAGLQYYAGAANDPETGYARKVMGTRERLVQAMRG